MNPISIVLHIAKHLCEWYSHVTTPLDEGGQKARRDGTAIDCRRAKRDQKVPQRVHPRQSRATSPADTDTYVSERGGVASADGHERYAYAPRIPSRRVFWPPPPSQAPRGVGTTLFGVVVLPYAHRLTPTTPRPHAKRHAAVLLPKIPIERRPNTRHESTGTPPRARSMHQLERTTVRATRTISPPSRIVDRNAPRRETGDEDGNAKSRPRCGAALCGG